MNIKVMRFSLILVFCFLWTNHSIATESPVLGVKVNEQDIRLLFDTGAGGTVLFSSSAERINLSWTDPPAAENARPGEIPVGLSEECRFGIGDQLIKFQFYILNDPNAELMFKDIDGFLAWSSTSNPIFHIDADASNYAPLKELPEDINNWSKSDLEDDDLLIAKIPSNLEEDDRILIDTGAQNGVLLGEDHWKDWLDKNKGQPHTLQATYTLAGGLSPHKIYCADELKIGNFKITNVLVSKQIPGMEFHYRGDEQINYDAVLGLYALSRLEIITDRNNKVIYHRPKSSPKSDYPINRAAAIFIPKNMNSDDLEAHVVTGGPTYIAGIRNGDILLKIDDLDVTKWKTNPEVLPLSRFWESPAGTELELTLKRDDDQFTTRLKLEEIFSDCTLGKNYSKEAYVEQKDIKSIRTLAYQYWKGEEVETDYNLAAKFFKKAAKKGDAESQFVLGIMYERSIGVPQDYDEALLWFTEAARQNNTLAQYRLGRMYYEGRVVAKDYIRAAKWFRLAGTKKHVVAQSLLGYMYYSGKGVSQDYWEALKWFGRAGNKGCAYSQFYLGKIFRNGRVNSLESSKVAIEWYGKAAEKGHAEAQYELGHMYFSGDGVPQDRYTAIQWFAKASAQGVEKAQYMINLICTKIEPETCN